MPPLRSLADRPSPSGSLSSPDVRGPSTSMSAESSNVSGNLSREAPAKRGQRGAQRGGHHQDYNVPPDPSYRGHNPTYQLRNSNTSGTVQYRDMDRRHGDARSHDQGRSHLGRNWRDNKATSSRLGADFTRGACAVSSGSRRQPTKPRDRLFEDYVREPKQQPQKEKQQQRGQRLSQQQLRDAQCRERDDVGEDANGDNDATVSDNRARSDRTRTNRVGLYRNTNGPSSSERRDPPPLNSANSNSNLADLTQPISKLNVHAREFTPTNSRTPADRGAAAGAEPAAAQNGSRCVANRMDAYGAGETSAANQNNGGANCQKAAGRGRGDPMAKAMMLAMLQAQSGTSRSAVKRAPTEESKAQKESMEEQLLKGDYDCVICCSRVRTVQAIWNCQACFHTFHLRCVAQWALKSVSDGNGKWRCPACQGESTEIPEDYYCFCGKQKNPQPSKMSLPHSCTELCQKERSCPHKCNKLCHPGRCPPCESTVFRLCQCGKLSKCTKCNSKIAVKCDQICGKALSCAKHECQVMCHPGDCEPCVEIKDITCLCGKITKQVLCAEPDEYSCHQPCEQKLSCGHHICEKTCHRKGGCGVCKLSMVKFCPCGRSPLPDDWNCSKPIPLCDAKCLRRLEDCEHVCEQTCHEGDCPPCPVPVKGRRCRCGGAVEEALCGEKVLVCGRRCHKKKSCGRHKCLDECCDKEFHICELLCGRKLSCGLHSCSMLCHRGACRKCDNVSFDELRCDCGHSVVYPPVACNAPIPECGQLCPREHRCSHPVTHPCHSEAACPPCTSLTEKKCHGGHELRRNIPCHLDNVSCGRPCGRSLPCGRHACDKSCHAGDCPTACEQPCKSLRKCGHPCKLPCHDECPSSTCFTQVEVSCACGRMAEPRTCHEFQQAVSGMIQQKLRRGEEVNLAKDLSQLSKGFLKCVERCAVEERNRRLAEALKINPDVPVFTLALYSDFVKEEARKNWHFASKIVNKLNELVELAKHSVQTSRSYGFEPMAREQRRFIYELLEVYRCTGQSYDQEPKRNIVVTAYKDKSTIPSMTLASAIGIVNPIPLRKM